MATPPPRIRSPAVDPLEAGRTQAEFERLWAAVVLRAPDAILSDDQEKRAKSCRETLAVKPIAKQVPWRQNVAGQQSANQVFADAQALFRGAKTDSDSDAELESEAPTPSSSVLARGRKRQLAHAEEIAATAPVPRREVNVENNRFVDETGRTITVVANLKVTRHF